MSILDQNILQRFAVACEFQQAVNPMQVEALLRSHRRGLITRPMSLREAWVARKARETRGAWVAWETRGAWVAREAREARETRETRGAWVAREARETRGAWVAREAREARETRESRETREAWGAREAGVAREAWVWREMREAWVAREAWDISILALSAPTGNMAGLMYLRLLEAGCWTIWYGPQDSVMWIEIPRLTQKNGRLHNSTGPAFVLPAQEEYFLHGALIPQALVTTPAADLDAWVWVTQEKNAEIRREAVRKIGIERVCTMLNAQTIDRHGDHYELLTLDIGDGRRRPYLKMRNPSIGVYHLEGVPPHIKTVKEALQWRNQTEIIPTVLT